MNRNTKPKVTITELLSDLEPYIYFNGRRQIVSDSYFQKCFEAAGGNFGVLMCAIVDNTDYQTEKIAYNLAVVDYRRAKKS